jgi:hypothetical protein
MPAAPAISKDAATDRGVYDSLEAFRSLLIPGEEIEAMAVQRRMFAWSHRRVAVAATSGRLIVVKRNLIAGYKPVDVRWQDIRESAVTVGVFGATLTISASRSTELVSEHGAPLMITVTGLRKPEAQEVYRVCQAREQAWREKRRVRELEEMRAKAGGVQLSTPMMSPPPGYSSTETSAQSPSIRLQRAKEMFQNGLLTDAEFEQVKAKILNEL